MRQRALTPPLALLVLVALAWPARARAELSRPYGATTGTSIEGSFGGNGITDDDYVDSFLDADIHALVGLSVAGYYRPIDYVSVGLVVHYAFLNPDFQGFDDEASGFLGILAEVRGHLPVSRVDPWIGFGLGYAMAFSTGSGDVSFLADFEGRLMLHGLGIGLSAGVNISITEQLALGPYFRMIFGAYPSGCFDGTRPNIPFDHVDECDSVDELYEDTMRVGEPHDLPHLWVVGLDVSYTFE